MEAEAGAILAPWIHVAKVGSGQSMRDTASPRERATWTAIVRALQHRNYRLFFAGQSVSLVGTWMTRIATSWLIYRLTGSALMLGLVGFAGQIPTFLLGPFAGVWVDRWDRHRVLIVTQILAMVQSCALAALTLSGRITVLFVILLGAFQGLINAFDMPARQAFVIEMVEDRRDLGNAIALNSSMVNIARLIGPSLAGIVIAAVGEGYCFLIDGVSYIAVVASLLAMRVSPVSIVRGTQTLFGEMREGWLYVSRFAPIRALLLLLAWISLLGMPYTVLMPIFAGDVLHGGPHTLGLLMGASGVGALGGAITLAARKSVIGLGRIVMASATAFGLGLMTFSQSSVVWVSVILMMVTGFAMMQQMAASNTILQTIAQQDKRGRVMSYYSMALMGMAPFGSLLAGSLAQRFGASRTMFLCGVGCVLGGLWFATSLKSMRRLVRPIYVELGIIPDASVGAHIPPDGKPPSSPR